MDLDLYMALIFRSYINKCSIEVYSNLDNEDEYFTEFLMQCDGNMSYQIIDSVKNETFEIIKDLVNTCNKALISNTSKEDFLNIYKKITNEYGPNYTYLQLFSNLIYDKPINIKDMFCKSYIFYMDRFPIYEPYSTLLYSKDDYLVITVVGESGHIYYSDQIKSDILYNIHTIDSLIDHFTYHNEVTDASFIDSFYLLESDDKRLLIDAKEPIVENICNRNKANVLYGFGRSYTKNIYS